MVIKHTELMGVAIITLEGNLLGGPDGAELHSLLRDLKSKGRKNVVVNLQNIKFMNSSGLGMLIGGMTTMRNVGGDFRLACVSDKVLSLLIITKLNTVFKLFDTLEEAIQSFENPS